MPYLGVCKHVSVYGLSSFDVVNPDATSGYHYQGRGTLRVTGKKVGRCRLTRDDPRLTALGFSA